MFAEVPLIGDFIVLRLCKFTTAKANAFALPRIECLHRQATIQLVVAQVHIHTDSDTHCRQLKCTLTAHYVMIGIQMAYMPQV